MKQLNSNKLDIECQWMRVNRILINPDGQVLPCCYLANLIYERDMQNTDKYKIVGWDWDHYVKEKAPVWGAYYKNKKQYNVNHTPLEEILNNEWFTKTLPESWDSEDTALPECKRFCRKKV